MPNARRTTSGRYYAKDPDTGRQVRISAKEGSRRFAISAKVQAYWTTVREERASAAAAGADREVAAGSAFRVLYRRSSGHRKFTHAGKDQRGKSYKSALGEAEEDMTEQDILEDAAGQFGPHFIPVKVLYEET